MRTIDELLAETPALRGLRTEQLELIAGCAKNRVFAPGEHLMREGEPAADFFVIREGDVALETFVPQRGALTIETLHDGDLVGWSWLVPPYRTMFDARAQARTRTVSFDGLCLRAKCEADHELGYELLSRFTAVIVERLQATRIRLLDLYGYLPG
ncbi:MAG TPA: cyclic nucleotide-binding domain-containing protein [Thermoleophilaceae bacterium]|jgi:CRP/FNR family transcriptional regulator, cyclic AMP receptor protein|nr:cyclic nucleotide-binding domain-containing protein [Thermoleophilaceae bacterium]